MSEMTATRTKKSRLEAWRPATIAALALLLAVAAPLLWRTKIPGDLELPPVEPGDYFSAAEVRKAERYERFFHYLFLAGTLASFVALYVMWRRSQKFVRTIGLGRVGSAVIVGMLTLCVLVAVDLPFSVAAQWWQRRHGLAHGSWVEWLLAPWLVLSVEAAFFLLFIVILVGLANRFRRDWWLAMVPVWTGVSLVFVLVYIALIPTYTDPLTDPGLARDAKALAKEIGAEGTPVDVEEMSDLTSQANAYAFKLGPLKRVVLWDTLLDGRFSDDEVRVVIAHELAHVAREHVLKGLIWFVLISLPLWFLIAEVTRRAGGLWEPANLPLGLLVVSVLTLVFSPVENMLSRRYEAEADWVALQATEKPDAAQELFRGFRDSSLSDPEPPTLAYVFFDTHPTLMQRIAMAEAWKKRASSRGAGSQASP
jgi:STE24 endopeptidase